MRRNKLTAEKTEAIIVAALAARPTLTRVQVGEYLGWERSLYAGRVTHFLATVSVDEAVEWVLQGIEE